MHSEAAIAMRRVVVTGIGFVSPLGVGNDIVWQRLLLGSRGGRYLNDETFANVPVRVAATVPRRGDTQRRHFLDSSTSATATRTPVVSDSMFDPSDWLLREDARTISGVGAIEYAMAASAMALESSGLLADASFNPSRCGTCIGTGMSPMPEIAAAHATVADGRARRVSPFFVPRVLTNMAAGHVSMRFGLRGPSSAPSTACTTGAHAIGDAARWLQLGMADYAVAGASEAAVEPLSIAGFAQARALARLPPDLEPGERTEDAAASLSKPFDSKRSGFVLGEGATVMILETLEGAQLRGAPIIAELVGYGLSSDAHHVTAPRPDGAGALASMRAACSDAARLAGKRVRVRSVNAHATSTPLGDAGELRAIGKLIRCEPAGERGSGQFHRAGGPIGYSWEEGEAVASSQWLRPLRDEPLEMNDVTGAFGDHHDREVYEEGQLPVPAMVCSTKGATGHLLGAAGAIEAAFAALGARDSMVPPTANLVEPDDEFAGTMSAEGAGGVRISCDAVKLKHTVEQTDLWLSNSFGFGGSNATLAFARYSDPDQNTPTREHWGGRR